MPARAVPQPLDSKHARQHQNSTQATHVLHADQVGPWPQRAPALVCTAQRRALTQHIAHHHPRLGPEHKLLVCTGAGVKGG